MELLKSLLKKVPKSRLSASQALEHPAFKIIDSKKFSVDDEQSTDHPGITQNLKDFHEKYSRS